MHKYKLKYYWNFENGEFSKEDLEEGEGACDAVLFASILYPDDGSYSTLFLTVDGRTNETLPDNEIFKVWLMLGKKLMDNKELKGWKAELVEGVHEAASIIIGARE